MVSIILTWFLIFLMSYGFGAVVLFAYDKCFDTKKVWTVDYYLVLGIMLLTVYSEFFSIFKRLGSLAILTCLVLSVGIYIMAIRKEYIVLKTLYKSIVELVKKPWLLLGGILIIWLIMSYTDVTATYGDTYSYHNQAIQWLNKYGVVPGLGNFHHRFAYNSAFLPLQALFSFNWLVGEQIHTMNGFLCACCSMYAILSNNLLKRNPIVLSDFFKMGIVVYILYNRIMISCPGTDIMPTLLAFYIVSKWAECIEGNDDSLEQYCILAVLGIFNVTVKLSFATMVLLVLVPLITIIKNKWYKILIINVIITLVIVLPWLIRNVIISGYLVYPLSSLDLFNVDWKMPISVVTYDKYEITAWARALFDVSLYDLPFREWFVDYWWARESFFNKSLMVIGVVSVIICIVYVMMLFIKKKFKEYIPSIALIVSIVLTFIYWLYQAPNMRFGIACIIMPVCVCLGININKTSVSYIRNTIVTIGLIGVISGLILNAPRFNILKYGVVFQIPYAHYNTRAIELEGYRAYTIDDIEGGTDVFPYVPYEGMLDKIELRGSDLSDGFRMKAEYRNASLTDSGSEWVVN